MVFQCLEQTSGMASERCHALDAAHSKRTNAEYEGAFDVNQELVAVTFRAAKFMSYFITLRKHIVKCLVFPSCCAKYQA